MLSLNLLKSKNIFTREFAKNFLSFQAKKCLGMVLDFEYQVVRVYEVYANHNKSHLFRHSLDEIILQAFITIRNVTLSVYVLALSKELGTLVPSSLPYLSFSKKELFTVQ